MSLLETELELPEGEWDESKIEPLPIWETRYVKAKTARTQFERQWYVNIAYFFGKQWVQWEHSNIPTALGQMFEPPANKSRTRLTINRVRKIMRKELARINKETIRGFVTPNTTDQLDMTATHAADKLVSYLTDVCKIPVAMKRCDFWMLLCGTAFVKDYYDETKEIGGSLGGPVIEAVSPFHLFVPNLDEPEIENQPWVMHVVVRDPSEVERTYGIKVDDAMKLSSTTVESRLMSIMGMTQDQAKMEGVEVKEVWVKPGGMQYPEGLHLVWTRGRILDSGPFPYTHGQFPFTRRQYVESGMFYASTLIEDLIPIQTEYNKTRSQIVEDKNKMAKPMLSAVEGSISPRKIRNVPGEIILHKPGTNPPTPIPLTPIPSYVIDHVRTLANEMDELASQSSEGRELPPGVTAATAIAYLQEDETSLLIDTIRDKEEGWKNIIQHVLSYVGQYWDAEHTVKTVGQNENFEAFTFKGSDLRGQTDWRVVVGSGTPKSYPAQQAQIMELLDRGVIPAAMALQRLELGDTARLYEEMQVDVREADLENSKMMEGIPTTVEDYQEHVQHIMSHDNFRKAQQFTDADEQVRMLFNGHVFLHICMFVMTNMPGMPLPFDPGLIAAVKAGQFIPPEILQPAMLQARGLLWAATMTSAPEQSSPQPGTTPQAQG